MSIANVFAIFYVAAQVIERITDFVIKVTKKYDDTKAEIKITEMRIENLKKKIDDVDNKEEEQELYYELENLLKYKNQSDNKMVFQIFIFTSILGILIASLLEIKFLEMLLVSSDSMIETTTVNTTVDTIITGLIIGSGTKPLHDLIKYLEKTKR